MIIPGHEYEDPLSSFQWPAPLPTEDPDAGPLLHVCFAESWLPYVLGCLFQLTQDQIWDTLVDADRDLALQRANQLIAMFEDECPMIPPGTIVQYAGATAPEEWLLCDGSDISRADFAALFAAIGITFGPGDGTTTFTLPNTQSRVPLGVGTGASLSTYALADAGGEETHTLSTGEIPSHNHTDTGHTHTTGNSATGVAVTPGELPVLVPNPIPALTGTGNAAISNTGGGGAHNNIQPYLALNFIIKT